MDSEFSSIPRSKPSECPSETWNELAVIINNVIDENDYPCNTEQVILEITDVNEDGQVMAVTETVQEILPNDVQTDPDYIPEENSECEKLSGNEEQVIIAEEKQNGSDKVLTRNRNRNPTKWKQNIRKAKRQKGEAYLDTKGTLKPPKKVKNETCHSEKCGFKCSQAITNEERGHIHRQFWKLNDETKVHFYSKHIKRVTPLRKRTKEESSKKKYSYEYHFVVSGVKIRVCQEYFLNTLNISKNRVYYFFKKNKNEDVPNSPIQGKHKKKFIPVAKKDEVRSHIKSFPSIDSHYCRALTKKKYLERGITLRKMYDLYRSSTENPVKFHMYSEIFNTEFNISFFKPKKDLCDKCELFKILKEPTEEEIAKQEEHIKRKNIGKQERDRDRKNFIEDDTVGVITFDLQNTFSLPKANVSNFYYKTKLSCYNLTAYLDKTNSIL